jgi:predicted Fe-S protein YdhL (DUF1289 family)
MFPNNNPFKQAVWIAAATAAWMIFYPFAAHADTNPTQNTASAQDRWNSLTPEQRQHILDNYHKWQAMSPKDRRLLKDRWQNFQSLPADRQAHIAEQWHHFQNLTPEQQAKIRANWERWNTLTPEEQAHIQAEYNQKHSSQKSSKIKPVPPKLHPR